MNLRLGSVSFSKGDGLCLNDWQMIKWNILDIHIGQQKLYEAHKEQPYRLKQSGKGMIE